jgi:nucleotidyltransferase substrate binding protein (TIGR01987 family)
MIDIKNKGFYYKLRTLYFVEEIALFGSRAKQTCEPRSDIDLAITCKTATTEDWLLIKKIIETADTLLKIDCIRLDTLNDERLRQEIESSKIILFKRIPNNYPWYELFLDLGEALNKFSKVIEIDEEEFPYALEATIQVFEYTFELYWKLLKKICLNLGIATNSPRNTLEQAFAMKLIDQDTVWLEIMDSRNLTSHTYKRPMAVFIYENSKRYCDIMTKNYESLKIQFKI